MAINTYRFWMATDANRLLANQNAFIQAASPSFYQGNVAQLELHIVASAGVGTSPVEVPFPAGAAISVAVGDTNTYPTGGTWELMVGTTETQPMPYNATTTQVAAALNALTEVSTAGGVTVSKTGDGYTITWNSYGLKPSIGIGSDTLTPSSYESISLVQEGDAETRQIVFIELRQNPIALGVVWTALPSPAVTVSEVQAWNGINRIWRVSIDPQPRAGTMTIAYGSKTATVAYNASTSSIASLLSPAQVFSTGQYQWDIAIAEDSVLTATGSLVGYNGFSGSINFATAECHQFLAGADRKATVLEVSMSVDSKRYTLIQTACNVFADVVSDGVLVPLPLGTAMSEQVANVRFVRRDIDQNPDSVTQDMIWQNLGVETLGSDVVGALNQADSPSAANPFVTLSDISGLGATWGNITGTLSDQTDLQSALDSKYDASNPSGFIPEANVDGNTYGRRNGQWETVLSTIGGALDANASVTASDTSTLTDSEFAGWGLGVQLSADHTKGTTVEFDGLDVYDGASHMNVNPTGLTFPDATVQTTAATSFDPTGYATESWVTTGFYPLTGNPSSFATESFVTSQGYITSDALNGYATESWVNSQGFVAFDIYNRITFGGGTNPDPSPMPGRFWFQSEKFRYSTSVSSLGNVIASESWVQGLGYAQLSGATFTGKVNLATLGVATPSINLGGQCDSAPASAANGDIWISNAAAPKLTYKMGGANYNLPVLNQFNTFTNQMVIDTTSSTTAALRVTQRGAGNAIEIEDSTTPDATKFVVDQFGKVGVGTAPDATAAIKVDANGISFNGLSFNPTATASHTGGSDTLDLLVTINGTNYRLGLRPA